MAPSTLLALMVGVDPPTQDGEEKRDIWNDVEVLRFLQTHKYGSELSAKERDRIYVRAKSCLSDNVQSGASMVIYGGMGACTYTINGAGAGICVLEP